MFTARIDQRAFRIWNALLDTGSIDLLSPIFHRMYITRQLYQDLFHLLNRKKLWENYMTRVLEGAQLLRPF